MFTDFCESQNVVLFAGGSGITFAASVLEEILGLAVLGSCRTRSVTLVWRVLHHNPDLRDLANRIESYRTMKAVECVEWYEQMMNSLLDVARTRTAIEVQICLFSEPNLITEFRKA